MDSAYYKKWENIAKDIDESDDETKSERFTFDPRAINPKDIGVTFGKPMTAAEFEEHRRSQGNRPVEVLSTSSSTTPIDDPRAKLKSKLTEMAKSRLPKHTPEKKSV
jgi:hypothetical protein